MVFFADIVEGTFGVGEHKTGNPGEYGWKVITSSDPTDELGVQDSVGFWDPPASQRMATCRLSSTGAVWS